MTGFHIFVLRAILGAVFAVLLSRMFYPQMSIITVAALGVALVGLAYLSEYLKRRNKKDQNSRS